jgi:hypothetical protein
LQTAATSSGFETQFIPASIIGCCIPNISVILVLSILPPSNYNEFQEIASHPRLSAMRTPPLRMAEKAGASMPPRYGAEQSKPLLRIEIRSFLEAEGFNGNYPLTV